MLSILAPDQLRVCLTQSHEPALHLILAGPGHELLCQHTQPYTNAVLVYVYILISAHSIFTSRACTAHPGWSYSYFAIFVFVCLFVYLSQSGEAWEQDNSVATRTYGCFELAGLFASSV